MDSAYLLYAAIRAGADVTAYCACTEFQPRFELEDAMALASSLGARLVFLRLSALEDETIVSNPENRCYFCKRRIFSAILKRAESDGYDLLLDGTNASDDLSQRPGSRALAELSVRSPLLEAGLTKAEIRQLSKQLGLPTWNKQSFACLSSRFVYGETINEEKLGMVDKAEQRLLDLGFHKVRVRIHGKIARIEIDPSEFPKILQADMAKQLNRYLLGLGFTYVTLDLGGYQTGSMNKTL